MSEKAMDNETAIQSYPMLTVTLPDDLGGGYEATFAPLARSLVGHGETPEEALSDLLRGVPGFLELMAEKGQRLPDPGPRNEWSDFSGKFNVRVPKALHAKLVRLADNQGVSLNSFVQTILMAGATALEAGCEFGVRTSRETDGATHGRSAPNVSPAPGSIAPPRQPGPHPGAMRMHDDFGEPLPDEFWTASKP